MYGEIESENKNKTTSERTKKKFISRKHFGFYAKSMH